MCSERNRGYSGRNDIPPGPTNSRGEYVGGFDPPGPGDERPESNYVSRQRNESHRSYGPSVHPKRDPDCGEY
jgi:hypothetical protein